MIDVQTVLTTVAVSKTTEKFVDQAWEKGSRWVSELYASHGKDVVENAKSNMGDFLEKLTHSVDDAQEKSKSDPLTKNAIDKSLKNPDFSISLQSAILASSKTQSEEKHEILARIITDRLLSEPEDIVSLATPIAIDAVSSLKAKHLYALGLASAIFSIRPQINPEDLDDKQRDAAARGWWKGLALPLTVKTEDLHEMDIQHLIATKCIGYEQFIIKDLSSVMKSGLWEWDTKKFLEESEGAKKMRDFYEKYITHMTLTSAGQLIGTSVADQITGKKTLIDWK